MCPCSLDFAEHFFRKHHLPLCSSQGTRRRRPAMRESSGEAHCHEGGAAGDPRRYTPGPGLSKLNSKASPRAPRSREVAGRLNRRGVNVISRRAPSTRRSSLEGENGAGRYVRHAPRDGLRRIEIHRIPRKEVIQPQLPLRLPCYDFTPVTNSTFDCSLPYGLGHRLRVSPASVV